MNLIILVCAVLSANTILGFVAGLIGRFLPKKWWIEWLYKIPGLGAGLLYLYFAGYYIMDKEANLLLAAVIALIPLVINLIVKIVTKASLMEE
ncbi:MAG: hypothetical protein J6J78_04990 [Clostridia bacterium]|nr:hypothetical protein [Clostridia bacterium]